MALNNPAMGVLNRAAEGAYNFGGLGQVATLSGATTKSILLVALTLVVGYVSMVYSLGYIYANGAIPKLLMYGSLIAAVVVALVTIFKPNAAPFSAPAYAVLEGGALGCISAVFEFKYPGIVSTAVMSTFVHRTSAARYVRMCLSRHLQGLLTVWPSGAVKVSMPSSSQQPHFGPACSVCCDAIIHFAFFKRRIRRLRISPAISFSVLVGDAFSLSLSRKARCSPSLSYS